MDFSKIKKVYFIGIGGIGISAIAKMFFDKNISVSGSDNSESIITKNLEELGVKINKEHKKENIEEDTDLVIYTVAIKENNPELIKAKEKNIPSLTYGQSLGIISKDLETIAISGTHGKTTTTAMIAKTMIDNHLDPTVILGSLLNKEKSNLIAGQSKYFVVEACEYKRSFLNLNPKILIINNIEEDHLDYYKDINDIKNAFRELAEKVPQDGFVIYNSQDKNTTDVIKNLKCNLLDYSEFIDYNLKLKVPGKHNKSNAGVVLALAKILNIKKENAIKSLKDFSGTWRRSEYKGIGKNGCLLYDDYAHHPREIETTIDGFKEMYPNKKIVIFFQPHSFSRTKTLFESFIKCFYGVDRLYLLPIFQSREDFDYSINSEMLALEIQKINQKVFNLEELKQIKKEIDDLDENYISITFGAGNIYTVYETI